MSGGVGATIGSIYSSFIQLSEVEKLFKVIKKQILDFSKKYPIKKEDLPKPEDVCKTNDSLKKEEFCKEKTQERSKRSVENKKLLSNEKIAENDYKKLLDIESLSQDSYPFKNRNSFTNEENTLDLFIDLWCDLIIFYLTKSKEIWDKLEKIISINIKNALEKLSSNEFKPIYENMQQFAKLIEPEWNKDIRCIPYLIEIEGILIDKLLSSNP